MTTGPGEVFDLGYRGYEGARTGRWSRRRAIWRDGVRISLGLGRGLGAKFTSWLLIGARARADRRARRGRGVPRSGCDEATTDFELPSYADYYDCAIVPLGLFAAVVGADAPLPRPPRRRPLALRRAPDHAGRLRRARAGRRSSPSLAVVGVAARRRSSSPGTCSTPRARRSWLADNWDVVPRFLLAGATVALVLTTLSLFAASFTTRRAYAAVAILAALFVGSAIGGIAEENFTGPVSDVLSLASVPQAITDSVHWIFGDPVAADRPLPGWASLLWLAGLTVGARGRARAADRAAGAQDERRRADDRRRRRCRSGSRGVVAVSDVSLVVEPGVTALLGPNGAGKTTLLRAIAGLTAPSQGSVTRLRRARPRQPVAVPPRSAYMPEHESVYDFLTGRQFVELSARLQGVADVDEAVRRAIETVDLVDAQHRRLREYSRGMRQRMRLAATLVHDPPLLMLDEPLSGTDPRQRLAPARRDPPARRGGPDDPRLVAHPRGGRRARRPDPPASSAASSPRAATTARSAQQLERPALPRADRLDEPARARRGPARARGGRVGRGRRGRRACACGAGTSPSLQRAAARDRAAARRPALRASSRSTTRWRASSSTWRAVAMTAIFTLTVRQLAGSRRLWLVLALVALPVLAGVLYHVADSTTLERRVRRRHHGEARRVGDPAARDAARRTVVVRQRDRRPDARLPRAEAARALADRRCRSSLAVDRRRRRAGRGQRAPGRRRDPGGRRSAERSRRASASSSARPPTPPSSPGPASRPGTRSSSASSTSSSGRRRSRRTSTASASSASAATRSP